MYGIFEMVGIFGILFLTRLKKMGDDGVLAMVCDSTNVFSFGRAGSESDVRKNI